jgi:hypothetical protein
MEGKGANGQYNFLATGLLLQYFLGLQFLG